MDHAFAASHLLDVMPNPWRGSEVARRVFSALLERHARALVVSNYGFILEELHKRLEIERDRLARGVFTGLLETGEMRFIVAAEDLGFNRLPRQIKTAPSRQANREDGGQYLLNLFDRTDENELENRVATFFLNQHSTNRNDYSSGTATARGRTSTSRAGSEERSTLTSYSR